MESPCTKICVLDAHDRCVGCERSIDEIARWTVMSEPDRQTVVADLDRRRRERLDAP
ncbi:MAG TPA: DUF1289 domain-containing protein [Acidimicrobiia bacterium]|nr:DUF1289 domain-containing protein [Acidimicrobiia bacterium]